MKTTVPQNSPLVNNLMNLLALHRPLFGQSRNYHRIVALVFAEVFAFGRHTVTQLLMTLGLNEDSWSSWYRIFSRGQFDADLASEVMFKETLEHVSVEEVYVVAGDGTQTPRTSKTMEGVGWLRNMRTPPFKIGIHRAQRWFNGSWLMPSENGYSRAMPLRWMPAFTQKSVRQKYEACKEWEAAIHFLKWVRRGLNRLGRRQQKVLMVVDGSYDTLGLWKNLPEGVIVLARSAKNRVLHDLLPAGRHGNRKYGDRALTPQQQWRKRSGWQKISLLIRGRQRKLQYRVEGPFLRYGAPDRPLFLIVVRGQKYSKYGRRKYRVPVPYLVNAIQVDGEWQLPLPAETLIFWAWQRWEIEVCHRELKSNIGMGDKQCWNPTAAVSSVQWSAWVYSLLLLSAYRTWGLCAAPEVPTRWWRGSGRWSFNTLWRAYRAEFWGQAHFRPLWHTSPDNWWEKEDFLLALHNSAHASTPL